MGDSYLFTARGTEYCVREDGVYRRVSDEEDAAFTLHGEVAAELLRLASIEEAADRLAQENQKLRWGLEQVAIPALTLAEQSNYDRYYSEQLRELKRLLHETRQLPKGTCDDQPPIEETVALGYVPTGTVVDLDLLGKLAGLSQETLHDPEGTSEDQPPPEASGDSIEKS